MPTRFPIEALDSALYFVKAVPIDRVGETIVRRALSRIWTAAPFTWTVGPGPGFNITAAVGSYDVTYPTDWAYAIKADYITGPNLAQRELEIVSVIEDDDGYVGQPSKIRFSGPAALESNVIVSPIPATVTGIPRVTSLYKRVSPSYSKDTLYTVTVPIPDDWFWVFEEAVLYEAYRYADDSRAGEARVQADQIIYGGQLGVLHAGLSEMRLREPPAILTGRIPQKDATK